VRSDARQTMLLVRNEALLCHAALRELESRKPDVRVSAVSSVETALQIIEQAAPLVVLLAEESGDGQTQDGKLPHGGPERVENIAALAMRTRETVKQLSHQREARNDPVGPA
jgi:hypothetical protein